MKKLIAVLVLAMLTTSAFGQGLVNFQNNSSTLISVGSQPIPSGQGGQYYFALLAAPSGTTDPRQFTFTGAYGTNQNAVAGRIFGGIGVVVNNWAAGETKAFMLVGWSALYNGTVYNPGWIQGTAFPMGPFGMSAIAPAGIAGGGPQSLPNLVLFGGTQGLQQGFSLIPEPTTMALAGFGAAALLIFRRRKGAVRP